MKTGLPTPPNSEEARRRQAIRIARLATMSLAAVYANWRAGKRYCAKHGWETEEGNKACRAAYFRDWRAAQKAKPSP